MSHAKTKRRAIVAGLSILVSLLVTIVFIASAFGPKGVPIAETLSLLVGLLMSVAAYVWAASDSLEHDKKLGMAARIMFVLFGFWCLFPYFFIRHGVIRGLKLSGLFVLLVLLGLVVSIVIASVGLVGVAVFETLNGKI